LLHFFPPIPFRIEKQKEYPKCGKLQLAALFPPLLFGIEEQDLSIKCGKLQLAALFSANSLWNEKAR
jgi:hypothetical protein